ncbi:hypothetical protein CJD36_003955 [Flavipsychrobacter stenotrophus]|uniref:Signal transduction histidine kinase internal region domain-containing protein n=1 Tax=Flavipsychrobacter stenotrophus TaxID=2077091 RepID=A0A2S7T126_9BACT|nr:hypothetical protein CJD36_003955 [Flavipsychrobacter stenotrophus]
MFIAGSKGQESSRFKINIYNDLPSNNVYNLSVDHLGYLWIATDKGVVKYNGYNLTTFDLNKGFINKDTWNLFEDKKGRMWLFSISDNLTYIYNNVAHKVVTPPDMGVFYPHGIYDYKGGIAFITSFTNRPEQLFCFIRNDSVVYTQKITKYGEVITLDKNNRLITFGSDGNFYSLEVTEKGVTATVIGKVKNYDGNITDLLAHIHEARYGTIGRCFFSYEYNKNYLEILDPADQTYRRQILDSTGNIKLIGGSITRITAITDHNIFYFDSAARVVNKIAIDTGIDRSNRNKITFELNDSFWHRIFATNAQGVIFLNHNDTFFHKKIADMDDAKFLGRVSDSVGFWYNEGTGTLYKIVNGAVVKEKDTHIMEASKIVPFDDSRSILLNKLHTYIIDNNSLDATELGIGGGRDAIVYDKTSMLAISNIKGFTKTTIDGDKLSTYRVEQNRYDGIAYDSLRQMFAVYNNRRILLFKDNKILYTIDRAALEKRTINNIKKIIIENKYGNIFIQENDRLIYLTDLLKPYHSLFDNYILDNAKIYLHRDLIIASDAFGILFSKIEGPGKFSSPVLYPNSKGMQYKFVYNLHVSGNMVLLKTDKGIFSIPLPDFGNYDSSIKTTFLDHKMTVSYNGYVSGVGINDTLNLQKKYRKLVFDVINPSGYGTVKYRYRLKGEQTAWVELDNDELLLPKMIPGRYYTLSIVANDKQWRSNVIDIVIYAVPEWYEKTTIQRVLWLSGFFLLIGAIYFIVTVTKRIVTKNEAQKNAKLELELKSVYSQINPHFIFNSLTAALYFIKTGKLDDAYNHIYKFSHLLRSYIKSSRNRLVTIGEEVKNLTNYIELQQARFKNKFDFSIIVDTTVKTNTNIPSLLLQPIVENAINHGLMPKTEKGNLLIQFKLNDETGMLICSIEDDGVGRLQPKKQDEDHFIKEESYGNELIKDLIDIFNKYEKMKIEIEYIDKQFPSTGTIVQLRIKSLS